MLRSGESWYILLFPEVDFEWSDRYRGIVKEVVVIFWGAIDLCCLYAD